MFIIIYYCDIRELNGHNLFFENHLMDIVESEFGIQVQNVWSLGSMSPIQLICREWVGNLGLSESDKRPTCLSDKKRKITLVS